MAHEISSESGRAEIAYTGQTPWHGLGVQMAGLQTPAAMLTAAGLDWHVSTVPLFRKLEAETGMELVPSHVGIQRDDTRRMLGVATARYQPIQNSQAGEIVDALVTEGGAHVEVAGALHGGEVCWMLAQLPGDFEVVAGDQVRPYFLLAWGHDGKHGVAGKLTMVRVVCANTLGAAGFGTRGVKWSSVADVYLRHYGNPSLRIDDARKALGLVKRQVESTQAAYQALAATALTEEQVAGYFTGLFAQPTVADGATEDEQRTHREKLARWTRHQEQLVQLYTTTGRGLDVQGVRGTAWAAYNAVTEWADHVYPVLQNGSTSKVRQQSVAFGSYGDTKAQALQAALQLTAAAA